jgi:iron complex transport system substrate-binding protein
LTKSLANEGLRDKAIHMKKKIGILAFILVIISFTACERFGKKEKTEEKIGKRRIVCVSKQINEIIYALGQQDNLVGVDISSNYPEQIKEKATVGYHRALNAEGIISLKPDVVFNDGNWGPENVIEQLRKVGIPLKQFPSVPNIDSTKLLFRLLANEFNVPEKGEEMCRQLDDDLKLAKQTVAQYKNKPKVLLIHYGRANNNYFVVGTKGFPNFMITEAGGINAADTSTFRMLNSEVIVKEQPDIILATDFGYDQQGSIEKFIGLPGISLTPAGKNRKIYRVAEHDVFYTGPRTGRNIIKLAEIIHQ